MSQTEEIKSRLDIVDLIREYMEVRAVGANFQALCPFHREKTPSFVISPEKQIWHCFGCGKGGDIFSFVMEMDKLDFKEALELLAQRAGVTLNPSFNRENQKKRRLFSLLKLATDYYTRQLNQEKEGESSKEYLLKRGLSRETINAWSIGYSPDSWDDLILYLKNQGYTDEEIFRAGLSVKKEATNNYYNRFRGRIMFPIKDSTGQVIAYSARISPDKEETNQMGKYINSPQTEVYDKSAVLFAFDKAKEAIKELGYTIIVEGQMDAIICHQFAYKNVVASSGTSLSSRQLNMIKKFSDKIVFAFDMDKAGQLAADRGIEEAMKLDMRIKILVLPEEYEDPADCLLKNPQAFKDSLKNSLAMMEYYFNKNLADRDLTNLEEKRAIAFNILQMIVKLNSSLDKDYWFKRLSESLDISEQILREMALDLSNLPKYPVKTQIKEEEVAPLISLSFEDKLIELFLSLLIKFPDLILIATNNIEVELLNKTNFQSFYRNLIIYYNKFHSLDYGKLRQYLKEESIDNVNLLDRLSLLAERDYYNFSFESAKEELFKTISQIKRKTYQQEIKKLENEMTLAEKENRVDKINQLMTQLKKITDNLNSLDNN
jgi:DNA primase